MIVLYIDDDASNRELITQILKRRPDVRLLTADGGLQGLRLARLEPPDLIVLDLHLPDIGGEAVLTRLRADSVTRLIPVVILSGDTLGRRRAALLAAGATAYLTKPIAMREFLGVVDRYRR